MKIKTGELSGVALDWAVGVACGMQIGNHYGIPYRKDMPGDTYGPGPVWKPSTDWSQGGPLIERFGISLVQEDGCSAYACSDIEVGNCWHINGQEFGDTFLVAAMRAIVAAKLGDEVDVPEGLA